MGPYLYKGKEVSSNYPVNFKNPYWSNKLKVDYLQRRVIVYSIQYYTLNNTCVSDKYFDAVSHQLIWYMQNTKSEELKNTTYWYCMNDFDGSTGFDLEDRLNEYDKWYLRNIADMVLNQFKKRKENNEK